MYTRDEATPGTLPIIGVLPGGRLGNPRCVPPRSSDRIGWRSVPPLRGGKSGKLIPETSTTRRLLGPGEGGKSGQVCSKDLRRASTGELRRAGAFVSRRSVLLLEDPVRATC